VDAGTLQGPEAAVGSERLQPTSRDAVSRTDVQRALLRRNEAKVTEDSVLESVAALL